MKYLVKQNWFILTLFLAVLFSGVILTSCKTTEVKPEKTDHRLNRWN